MVKAVNPKKNSRVSPPLTDSNRFRSSRFWFVVAFFVLLVAVIGLVMYPNLSKKAFTGQAISQEQKEELNQVLKEAGWNVFGTACPGGSWCHCEVNADCDNNLCVDRDPEIPALGKMCTTSCTDTCPTNVNLKKQSLVCTNVDTDGGTINICSGLKYSWTLKPEGGKGSAWSDCNFNKDCDSGFCVERDPTVPSLGKMCSKPCASGICPSDVDGYGKALSCVEVQTGSDMNFICKILKQTWIPFSVGNRLTMSDSQGNKFCLAVKGGVVAEGSLMMIDACKGYPSQQWIVDGDVLRSALNKEYCLVADYKVEGQVKLSKCKTSFRHWKYTQKNNLRYLGGLCLAVKGDYPFEKGESAVLWTCNDGFDQTWFFEESCVYNTLTKDKASWCNEAGSLVSCDATLAGTIADSADYYCSGGSSPQWLQCDISSEGKIVEAKGSDTTYYRCTIPEDYATCGDDPSGCENPAWEKVTLNPGDACLEESEQAKTSDDLVLWCTNVGGGNKKLEWRLASGMSCSDESECQLDVLCLKDASGQTVCTPQEVCDDQVDNDGNGQTDCKDTACAGNQLCPSYCQSCSEECTLINQLYTCVECFKNDQCISNSCVNNKCVAPQTPTTLAATLYTSYPFDGNAKDVAGKGKGGSDQDVSFLEPGIKGKDVSFAGSADSYITLPSSAVPSTSKVSFAVWIYPQKWGTSVLSMATADQDNSFLIFLEADQSLSITAEGQSKYFTVKEHGITLNAWHHLVVTKDLKKFDLYVSGKHLGQFELGKGGPLKVQSLILGQEQDFNGQGQTKIDTLGTNAVTLDSAQSFQGYMDELRVYEGVLQEVEIQTLFSEKSKDWCGLFEGCLCPLFAEKVTSGGVSLQCLKDEKGVQLWVTPKLGGLCQVGDEAVVGGVNAYCQENKEGTAAFWKIKQGESCVVHQCVSVAQCDGTTFTCLLKEGSSCSKDAECSTGLSCVSGACAKKIVSIVYGDVDGVDGVTSTDALKVLQAVVGKITLTADQTKAGDVDCESGLSSTDALKILQKVVAKITKFPVEEGCKA